MSQGADIAFPHLGITIGHLPKGITIGGFTIAFYGIIIACGMLAGLMLARWQAKRTGQEPDVYSDYAIWGIIFAIIGARLYYVAFSWDAYKNNLLQIFNTRGGGLAIYGGVIAGILYILYYCKKKNLSFVRVLDIYSLSLLLGQSIGRWGNFFNQEAYGGKTTLVALKNLHLPKFIIDGMYIDGFYRQPTFLYESIWCFIGVLILIPIRRKYSNQVGRQISFYFIWYGIGRFFIEGLRSDSLYWGSFRVSQIVSLILVALGIGYSFWLKKRKYQGKGKEVSGSDGRI